MQRINRALGHMASRLLDPDPVQFGYPPLFNQTYPVWPKTPKMLAHPDDISRLREKLSEADTRGLDSLIATGDLSVDPYCPKGVFYVTKEPKSDVIE